MKNIARKLSALLLVFVVSAAALCPAFAATASLPSLPSGQCVVDDANVLSSSTEQTIIQLNNQLQANCKGATIGVLTVDYTGSCTTEEYALQAANAWGIGSSTGNNGVLILLVMETQQYADGDYYIATGDGFRNTTLESQASALAQTMEDDFVRQDYDDAVTTCARNVAQTIADIYGVSLSDGNTNNGSYNEPAYDDNSSGGLGDILLGFITILFTVVLLLIILSVVVISGIFSAIYKPENGMLNSIIGLFRDMTDPILWKGEKLVIPSIIIAMVWQAVGYYMVMYMASMSSVPASLYESANLDGAGRLTQFFQITIPLIWTNIRTTLTFFIISTINMAFLFVKAMTSGGPNGASDVALSYMYSQKDAGLYGYSMAIGVVIFLFSFALSACVNKATDRDPLEF